MNTNETKPPAAPKVQRYWAAVAKRLGIEAQDMASLINHNGERGRANESSFGELFQKMLPPSVRVSSGEIIDSDGTSSPQIDTLVLSNTLHPLLFAQTEEMLFPVETVLLCIEVKTTLTSEEVQDIAEKMRKHQSLKGSNQRTPPFAVFAHKAGGTPKTIAKWFFELDPADRPVFFLVNDSAVFGSVDNTSPSGYQVMMPIAPLPGEADSCAYNPAVTADPNSWKPIDLPRGAQVRIDQGAAMLLFVRESLKMLSESGHADIAWLAGYLDKIRQQHVRYDKGVNGVIVRS